MKTKAPIELFWVLFALSCRLDTHKSLAEENTIHTLLDICTYEIYQKSDPRPLVKVLLAFLFFKIKQPQKNKGSIVQ